MVDPVGPSESGTDKLDDGSVGDPRLPGVSTRDEHHATGDPDRLRERLAQTGLADPGLALDDHHPAVRPGPTPRFDEDRELAIPAHDRHLPPDRQRCLRTRFAPVPR